MDKVAVLEGLLFVIGEDGLSIEQIKEILEVEEEESKELIKKLREIYEEKTRGLRINRK